MLDQTFLYGWFFRINFWWNEKWNKKINSWALYERKCVNETKNYDDLNEISWLQLVENDETDENVTKKIISSTFLSI